MHTIFGGQPARSSLTFLSTHKTQDTSFTMNGNPDTVTAESGQVMQEPQHCRWQG
jgi:hypothetical protein